MKHTKGKWTALECKMMVSRTTEVFSGDPLTSDPIMRILHNEALLSEAEANAKLIAAAPELLEVLNDVLANTAWHSIQQDTLEKARQVIKKATL